tara:strand:+ start:9409 stop:10461 length:1053 start_codon:yes stop_codon:yes gene_type:complete
MPVSAFSTTASDNGNRLPSGTAVEGMSPSQINDSIRALMQCVREWYNEGEWIEYGSGNGVVTYTRTGNNSLSIPANVVTQFHVNRRVKIKDGQGNTLYGRVTSSSYSSPNTNVNLEFDGGSILGSGNPVEVKFGIVSSQNTSMPSAMPVATVVSYAGATAPQGFLICDGSLVSKTTYGDLFAILGNTYGTATATQFYLPNLQSKFPIGKSSSYALGSTGGSFSQTPTGSIASTFSGNSVTPSGSVSVTGTVAGHAITQAQLPNVNLSTTKMFKTEQGADDRGSSSGAGGAYETAIIPLGGSGQTHSHGFSGSGSFSGNSLTPTGSVSSAFTGSAVDVTNPYISLNYIIKF